MKTNIVTIQVIILFLVASLLMAQDSKFVHEKIKNIGDNASKIVITTEKGDVTFEGDEAKELLKMIKAKKHKKIEWVSDSDIDLDFDSEGENVFIFKSKDGEKHFIKEIKEADNVMIFGDDEDIDLIDGTKRIKVEVEDGEKTVTVTTKEDGEEKTETFTGKEAEEYLENIEDDNIITIDIEDTNDGDRVWITNSGKGHKTEKDVKVELEDGKRKVTVKTITDGEEKVEVFEGDEADEFLKSGNSIKKKIKVKGLKDGIKKKIIIKEIEEDDKEIN
jgi:hypothetical protein